MKFSILKKSVLLISLFLAYPGQAREMRAVLVTHDVSVKAGQKFQGIQFPVDSIVTLVDSTNSVAFAKLSEDFGMNGNLLKKGTQLSIWPDGVLMEIYPVAGQEINRIVFAEKEATYVRFSHEGKIEGVHLNVPKEIQKIKFAENSEVVFYPNGKVFMGLVTGDQEIRGLNLVPRSEIKYYPSTGLKSAKIAKDSEILADFEPKSAMPQKLWVKGDPNPANPSDIEFWPDQRLKRAILSRPMKIQGYICGIGPVTFFESGKLQTLILGEDRVVTLKPYAGQTPVDKAAKAGDKINFNDAGDVIGWGGK